LALQPAEVVAVDGRALRVRLAGTIVAARLATPPPWLPSAGDVLLVAGTDAGRYAIGVLEAREPGRIAFDGDIELCAPHGTLRVTAGKGVVIASEAVDVEAERLSLCARTLVERVADAFRTVRGLLQVTAGRTRTLVTGSSYHKAERAYLLADKEVKLNAESINLG
jgi:hypothetical protein